MAFALSLNFCNSGGIKSKVFEIIDTIHVEILCSPLSSNSCRLFAIFYRDFVPFEMDAVLTVKMFSFYFQCHSRQLFENKVRACFVFFFFPKISTYELIFVSATVILRVL